MCRCLLEQNAQYGFKIRISTARLSVHTWTECVRRQLRLDRPDFSVILLHGVPRHMATLIEIGLAVAEKIAIPV